MAKLRVIDVEIDDASVANYADLVRAVLGGAPAADQVPPRLPPAGAELEPNHQIPVGEAPARNGHTPPIRRSQKALAAPAEKTERASTNGGDTIPARILGALQKRPMSSLELAKELKLEPQQVYAPCSNLKAKNVIETRIDQEGDGTRRWHVKR